ncbi:hypothetical protein CBL_12321 [Carabus blaptoides fortunei]
MGSRGKKILSLILNNEKDVHSVQTNNINTENKSSLSNNDVVDNYDVENEDEESSSDNSDSDNLETTTNSDITLPYNNNWHTIEDQSSIPVPLCQEMSTYNFEVSDIKSPLNAYELFISEEMIDLIVKETNRYAEQCLQKCNNPKSRLTSWINTDKNEIKRFFSIILAMGVIKPVTCA